MRSTTLSSLDWAEPRLAMIACRPVRISRAEVAALSGICARLSDAPPPCHASDQKCVAVSSAVPARDRHPLGFDLHPFERFGGEGLVEVDAAMVIAAPDHGCKAVKGSDDNQHIVARRRHVARVESSALG